MLRDPDVPDRLATLTQALTTVEGVAELEERYIEFARDVLGAPAIGVYLLQPRTFAVQDFASHGVSDFFLARYEEIGRHVDPLLERVLRDHAAVDNRQIMTPDEWRRTPIYREVLHLHGFEHIIQAPIICGDEVLGVLILGGTSDWAEGTSLRPIASAVGRIVGAGLLSLRRRETAERERDQLIHALEFIGDAVVVTDAKTGKRYQNRRARRLLDGVRDHGIERLDDLIALQTPKDGIWSTVASFSGAGSEHMRLHVQSIVPPDDPAIMVSFLKIHGLEFSEIPEIYAQALGRRELEVAKLVIAGLHDNEIADQLHISQHTVKQYLKSVYRKMGVGSRVELTRLFLADIAPDAPGSNGAS